MLNESSLHEESEYIIIILIQRSAEISAFGTGNDGWLNILLTVYMSGQLIVMVPPLAIYIFTFHMP